MNLNDYNNNKSKNEQYDKLTARITELKSRLEQTTTTPVTVSIQTRGVQKEYKSYRDPFEVNPDIDFEKDIISNLTSTLAAELKKKITALETEREAL